MAYLFMRSPGGMCLDIESWHRVNFSPCGPLAGLFRGADMPPYGLVSEWTKQWILIGASQLLPGLWGLITWKFVFALAEKEVAEIRSQE